MKKLLFVLIFIFLNPSIVLANIYYVSQSGSGDGSGNSFSNMASVDSHNAGSGNFSNLDGDTIVLCGTISTAIIVPDGGTANSIVTYDGNAYAYNNSATDTTIVVSQPQLSGFEIESKSNITVSNLKISFNYNLTMGNSLDNLFGLRLISSNNIILDSLEIFNAHNGIGIFDDTHDVIVTNSFVHDIAESGIYISNYYTSNYPYNITIGGSSSNGNTFKNCTYKTDWNNNTVGYDIRVSGNVHNLIISHNEMYSDTLYKGMSGVLLHSCHNVLIEYNIIHDHKSYNHRPGISIKGEARSERAYNIVIRFNKIFNESSDSLTYAQYGEALSISGNWENIYIYGNYIDSCGGGIIANFANWVSPSTHSDSVNPKNMYIWSNIISNTTDYGISFDGYSAGTDKIVNSYIINNTLYRVATSADYTNWAGISNRLDDSQIDNLFIENNVIVDPRIDLSEKYSLYSVQSSDIHIANNIQHLSNDIFDTTFQDSGITTVPLLFTNSENKNITIEASSLKNFSGLKVDGPSIIPADVIAFAGNFDFSMVLDPANTDWTKNSIKVTMLHQAENNLGYVIGAYAYTIADNISYPQADEYPSTISAPFNLRIDE